MNAFLFGSTTQINRRQFYTKDFWQFPVEQSVAFPKFSKMFPGQYRWQHRYFPSDKTRSYEWRQNAFQTDSYILPVSMQPIFKQRIKDKSENKKGKAPATFEQGLLVNLILFELTFSDC